jgi:hypothetical protein
MNKNTEYDVWDSQKKEWYLPDHDAEIKLVGNTGNAIDWTQVVANIENLEGIVLPKLIWPNPHFSKMRSMYENSNYIMDSAEWINYYPDQHYDEILNKEFGKTVGKLRYARAWISRINPGKTAPWHWDLDDGEEEYLKEGKLVRYSCKMSEGVAQVAIVGNTAIHGGMIGDIHQWPDHRLWHGSVNAGLTPKYQFNYLAYDD